MQKAVLVFIFIFIHALKTFSVALPAAATLGSGALLVVTALWAEQNSELSGLLSRT